MKMAERTYNKLKGASDLISPEVIQAYKEGKFPKAEQVKDLNVRFRYDVYNAFMRRNKELAEEIRKDFKEQELIDAHIDTALKRIIPDIV